MKKRSRGGQRRASNGHDGKQKISQIEEDQEKKEFEFALDRLRQFNGDRWMRLVQNKREMAIGKIAAPDPGSRMSSLKKSRPAVFFPSNQDTVKVRALKKPKGQSSFGYVGKFVRLEANSPFVEGTLAIRYDPKKLGAVAAETLRIFHWNDLRKEYVKINGSRVSEAGRYVWARISRPGDYALIGLNTQPQIFWTLQMFSSLSGFAKALPEPLAGALRRRVCPVVSCNSGLRRIMSNPRVVHLLRREMAEFGIFGGFAAGDVEQDVQEPWTINPCGLCREGDLPFPPEHVIFEDLEFGCADGEWESLGPTDCASAVLDVALDPGDTDRIYAASNGGGIFGLSEVSAYPSVTFRPLTDYLPNLRMQAVAVAPTDGRIVYAGNRMGWFRARLIKSVRYGEGDWIDPSETETDGPAPRWEDHQWINRILIDPDDHRTVHLASADGFKVTRDGGATWERLVTGDVLDAARDPEDRSIFYLAIRDRANPERAMVRYSGIVEDILTREHARSLVESEGRRWDSTFQMRIAVGHRRDGIMEGPANRTVVAKFGSNVLLNRTRGDGEWMLTGVLPDLGPQDWAISLAVDPFDNNIILSGEIGVYRTENGYTWLGTSGYTHVDHHAIRFDQNVRGLVYLANDGGIYRSTNSGADWTGLNLDLVTTEIERAGVHDDMSVANIQDRHVWGTQNASSRVWTLIGYHEWDKIYGDPKRANRFYMLRGEGIYRIKTSPGGGFDTSLLSRPRDPSNPSNPSEFDAGNGSLAVDQRYESNILLFGARIGRAGECTLRMTLNCDPPWDEPAEWTIVLRTGTDPIASIVFEQRVPDTAYAITESGWLYYSSSVSSGRWSELGDLRLPVASVRQLAIGTRLYAITGDSLWRLSWTVSGSRRRYWERMSPPEAEYKSIVTYPYPYDENVLFLGTDTGVMMSPNQGVRWNRFDDTLPNAEVSQIFFDSRFLYAATYGRGLWRRRLC